MMLRNVTREEKVTITLQASVTKASKRMLTAQLKVLGQPLVVKEGDTVAVSYDFAIDYLDGIDKRFQAIFKLLESGHVDIKSVNYRELKHGRILLQDLLRKMDALIFTEETNATDRGKSKERSKGRKAQR
jgi:hypothetical protein